jgi:hypothetical protein
VARISGSMKTPLRVSNRQVVATGDDDAWTRETICSQSGAEFGPDGAMAVSIADCAFVTGRVAMLGVASGGMVAQVYDSGTCVGDDSA